MSSNYSSEWLLPSNLLFFPEHVWATFKQKWARYLIDFKEEVTPENMVAKMKAILHSMQGSLNNVANSIYEPLKTVMEGTMV